MIDEIKFKTYVVLPLVYDDALSFYELVGKCVQKINEIIPIVNVAQEEIDKKVSKAIQELIDNGTLNDIINNQLFNELNQKIDNNTKEIQKTNAKITEIGGKTESNTTAISSLNTSLSEANSRITNINDNLTNLTNRYNKLVVNVKDYGAMGDGTTNDTDAINAALNACVSLGCNSLYFPNGTYLTDPITISSTVLHIFGDTSNTSKIRFTSGGLTVSPWYCLIENLGFLGSENVLTINGPSCIVNNIFANSTVVLNGTLDILMYSTIDSSNSCVLVKSGDKSISIFKCTLRANGESDVSNGVLVEGGCSALSILYCNIIQKENGIKILTDSGSYSIHIIGNYIDNSKNNGIAIAGSGILYRSMIANNWIGSSQFGIATVDQGRFYGLTVRNNEFFTISNSALLIRTNCTDLCFTENVIGNCSNGVNNNTQDITLMIQNNVFGGYGGEGMVDYALSLSATPSACIITGNNFRGSRNILFGSLTPDNNHIYEKNLGQ